jgi:hypothetical protein
MIQESLAFHGKSCVFLYSLLLSITIPESVTSHGSICKYNKNSFFVSLVIKKKTVLNRTVSDQKIDPRLLLWLFQSHNISFSFAHSSEGASPTNVMHSHCTTWRRTVENPK